VTIINGTGGLIEHAGLLTVVLRDVSGVVHVFQNGKINLLPNMTKGWSGMVLDIGVA
jgi:moderate conductance mechanosensitive channel